jgi:hypothetical protein
MYVMAWLDPTARFVTAHWTATVHDHALLVEAPSAAPLPAPHLHLHPHVELTACFQAHW